MQDQTMVNVNGAYRSVCWGEQDLPQKYKSPIWFGWLANPIIIFVVMVLVGQPGQRWKHPVAFKAATITPKLGRQMPSPARACSADCLIEEGMVISGRCPWHSIISRGSTMPSRLNEYRRVLVVKHFVTLVSALVQARLEGFCDTSTNSSFKAPSSSSSPECAPDAWVPA